MNKKHPFATLYRTLALASVLSLAACGSGASLDGVIGGTGIKGPVNNATVAAYAINAGAMGQRIGTTTSNASGNFNVSIGAYSGPVMLQMSGGTYTDEATGTMMSMAAGDVMSAVLPSVASGAIVNGVQMTPVTSMAQTIAQHLSGGMTDANIAAANAALGTYFMVSDILHVQPMNPLVAGAGSGATQDAKNYGMTLAAMSQYATSQGLSYSSAMVTALMSDASDGVMDGMMGGGAVMMGGMGGGGMSMPASAGTAGLANAMANFVASAHNQSGVSAATMQALMNHLSGSDGNMLGGIATPVVKGTINGTIFDGVVKSATVTAFAVTNGTQGAQIASAPTDAQGHFTIPIGSYAGPLMVQASHGTYVDAATGTTMMMGASDVMTAVMPTVSSGATMNGVWVTPLTAMAQVRAQAMSGGMSDANIMAANAAVGNYFMVSDPLHLQPMNTLMTGSATTATQAMKNYGVALAAMSQYAMNSNVAVSSNFVTAMMGDAADGILDGRMGGGSISMPMGGMMSMTTMMSDAGTSGLATAMSEFLGSSMNMSGATAADMAALMEQLRASNGMLQ